MKPLLSALAIAALLLAGCGDDDDSNAEAADTAELDTTDTGGGAAAPDLGDFPIPAPPGTTEAGRTEVEGNVAIGLTVPVDSYDDVIAFYDGWTDSESDDYQRVEAASGGVSWIRTSGSDEETRSIMLSAPIEGGVDTIVALTAGSQPG